MNVIVCSRAVSDQQWTQVIMIVSSQDNSSEGSQRQHFYIAVLLWSWTLTVLSREDSEMKYCTTMQLQPLNFNTGPCFMCCWCIWCSASVVMLHLPHLFTDSQKFHMNLIFRSTTSRTTICCVCRKLTMQHVTRLLVTTCSSRNTWISHVIHLQPMIINKL